MNLSCLQTVGDGGDRQDISDSSCSDAGKSMQAQDPNPPPHPISASTTPVPSSPQAAGTAAKTPCASASEGELSEDAKTLRQAVHALLTFSHREFLLRSQLTDVVKHNTKPPPEEIERQLGLPATTISSQLTKTFLTAGFQHYQRSGMTTGNAPQNFEPINCPPSLSRTDGSCCYRLHKEVPPRRFSLMPKFFRFRDRMRNNASYNIKFPPPVLANTNFSNPVVPSLPLPIAFPGFTAGGPHGYTHESPDFQQAPRTFHAGAASGMPTAGQGDPVTASYAVEEHPSHPYGSALTPSPPVRPVVEIRPYQTDKGPATSPQGPEVQQTEGIGNSDQTNGSRIEAVTERRSSHLVHRRASSAGPATVVPLGSAFDSGLAHESIQEPHRSKSLAESNYVQPGAVGDSFGGEPCVQDYYVPEPRHALSPYDARGSLAGKSSWPAPSSWVSSNAFLPSGADIKRTEPHAILTESGMPPVAGNRLMTIGPWESKVDSSEPSVAGHNAFSHEPPPVAVNGDGSRFSGSQQVRGTDRGPWQYMVQED
ncbi:hypothetical protein TGRUB_216285 [Toxoplasma gondii RUB]|uniref:Uncharacterized protein n=1 Tax=Toxoplasma gondii RUB TaxID=935652 RepID=A0A086LP23_TOXGO|nr:hypothetical protein TGRUB_216285 [Toxoplasma gondii RUB]